MSMMSAVATFFRDPAFSVCLAVFDTRRGQKEGEEYDKVMGFFPTSAPITVRTAIVGLSQAVSMFLGSFDEDDNAPVKVMEAQNNRWLSLRCEPCIWFLAVLSKTWAGPSLTDQAVETFLKSLYTTFVLLHGPINRSLEQDVSGATVRRGLQPLLDEVAGRLVRLETRERAQLANPLGAQHQGLPYLKLSQRAFLSVQCLVNQLTTTCFYGGSLVAGAMALHHDQVLWSSLAPEDSWAVYQLAARVLVPVAAINYYTSTASRQKGGPKPFDVQSDTLASTQHWQVVPHDNIPTSSGAASSPPPSASSATSTSATSVPSEAAGYLTCRLRQAVSALLPPSGPPPQPGEAQQQQQPGISSVLQPVRLWLQGAGESVLLLPYHQGPLLVVMLLQDGLVLSRDVLTALSDVLTARCPVVAALLADEVPGRSRQNHFQGYRYCFADDICGASRASPIRKVATLSLQSMQLMAGVSNNVSYWADGAEACSSDEAPSPSSAVAKLSPHGDMELIVRSWGGCWVIVRRCGRRRLHVVLESPPDPTLAPVAKHVLALCSTAFPGMLQ